MRAADDAEAARISGRMLRFALSAHLATAVAAAAIAYVSDSKAGYYVAGIFLLSTAFRPAGAYVAHVRERIMVLTRESTHPRDDVAALREKAEELGQAVDELRTDLQHSRDDLRGGESALADSIAHARELLTADLSRLQDAQAADRIAARSRDDELSRRIDQMVRTIEATLDGISDHQELLAGLRALVRMVRSEPPADRSQQLEQLQLILVRDSRPLGALYRVHADPAACADLVAQQALSAQEATVCALRRGQ